MKNTATKLQELLIGFDDNDFYCITLYEGVIKLQGKYTSALVQKAKTLGFSNPIFTDSNYIQMEKEYVEITLTE